MITNDKRIRIIVGHYGSGKSEFSINYVVKLKSMVRGKVALADMDIVNVYFRTREKKDFMKSLDIIPISSSISASSLDVPSISAGVKTPMSDRNYNYVIDLGGDNVGAKVIRAYKDLIKNEDYDMFFVINANREKTQTANEVIEYINSIENASNLKITGLVNNTHMIRETTIADIAKGNEVAKEVSKKTGLPVKYTVCIETLVDHLPENIVGEIFPIKLYMRQEWL